jgi:hypothetical protein
MNYEIEIIKLLMDDAQLREDYPRICAVAKAVARQDEDYMEYLWAYTSGKRDWKRVEKELP